MNNDFIPRPEGALLLEDIEIGLRYYHVYGFLNSNRSISEGVVLSLPTQYKNLDESESLRESVQKAKNNKKKPEYITTYLLDSIVLKVQTFSRFGEYEGKVFAKDLSLLEERHNNNFIFANKEDAEEYVKYLKA